MPIGPSATSMGVSTSLDTNGIWECPLPTDCGHSGQVLYKGMSEFLYSAWFVDENALPNDQDREWVAFILIDADFADAAKSCGDSFAQDRDANSLSECLLRSSRTEEHTSEFQTLMRTSSDVFIFDNHILYVLLQTSQLPL